MVGLIHRLTNLLFFGISLLYYYANFNLSIICYLSSGTCILIHTYFLGTNLNSSIICFLSSGIMYLFLWIVNSTSSLLLLLLLLYFFFETLVILSAILLPIRSPVASAVFFNCSFWCCFYCICCRFFSTIKKFLIIFITYTFTHILSKGQKSNPFSYILSLGSIEYLIFTRCEATSVFKHVIDDSFNYHC